MGFAPVFTIAFTVATYVFETVITSSPVLTPKHLRDKKSAS